MSAPAASSADDRSVLAKAFRILGAFESDHEEISLVELAELTGLPKPTAHRLAGQLVAVGALERYYGNYRLGMRMFEIGGRVHMQRYLRERAQPFLADLYEATHETVHLGVRDGLEVLYIDKVAGHNKVDVPTWIGCRMPLYCTGLGKVILAYSEQQVVDEVIERGLARRTPYTIVAPQVLVEQLEQIRSEGVGYEWEESTIGVTCGAAVAMDRRGRPVAAMSVTGPMTRFDPGRVTPALKRARDGLQAALSAWSGTV